MKMLTTRNHNSCMHQPSETCNNNRRLLRIASMAVLIVSVIFCCSCVHCHCGCHAALTMAVDSTVEGDNLDSLPTGYRFVPTDEELISYLLKKIKNETLPKTKINEAHIYGDHPKDLAVLINT
ncbi:hypothetical protein R6Q59_011426 [Mikania micrantha]